MIFNATVALNSKQEKLVDYLARRFTYHCKDIWVEKVRLGQIQVNGKRSVQTDYVYAADVIAYDAGEFVEPAADLDYSVIAEDEWVIAVNKPGNLLVHRAGKSFRNNLTYLLRSVAEPPYPDANAIHRIDRETSGVILMAKNQESMSRFALEFKEGRVQKCYRAVVHGSVQQNNLKIDKPIAKDCNSKVRHKFCTDEAGKPALTEIVETTVLPSNKASLLTIKPHTGRTHQIRVHLASIGHPIIGDKLYSLDEEKYLAWLDNSKIEIPELLMNRQALHCESLQFTHPFTGREMELSAPVPKDIEEFISACSE